MTKWIIGLGVLVIIGVGLWWSGVFSNLMPSKTAVQNQATTTPQQTQQQQQPVNDLPTATSDNSDAAIVQDSAAIDAQMQSLSSDSSAIDSSINDKPVTQEY
jgi:cytoskeletal protein RodZ